MGHRLSKLYTRTGDAGETGLGDGQRVGKDSLRVAALGSIDETNAAIGLVLACPLPQTVRGCLTAVQHQLFDLGGELCIPGYALVTDEDVERLEQRIDAFNADLPPLKEFILPAGDLATAHCHLARTICRRAERDVVAVARSEAVRDQALRYVNRLSDLLFVVARVIARQAGSGEMLWQRGLRDLPTV